MRKLTVLLEKVQIFGPLHEGRNKQAQPPFCFLGLQEMTFDFLMTYYYYFSTCFVAVLKGK